MYIIVTTSNILTVHINNDNNINKTITNNYFVSFSERDN